MCDAPLCVVEGGAAAAPTIGFFSPVPGLGGDPLIFAEAVVIAEEAISACAAFATSFED